MPPARGRAPAEDLKSEAHTAKERNNHHGTVVKTKKNGINGTASAGLAAKDTTHNIANQSTLTNGAGFSTSPGIDWATEDSSLLHTYRGVYNLETPGSFTTAINTALLTMPGIGRQSPTMAARKRAKRNIPKDQLAMTVRKHFNGLAVNETDVVVNFLYKVKNNDRSFKMKFGPSKK